MQVRGPERASLVSFETCIFDKLRALRKKRSETELDHIQIAHFKWLTKPANYMLIITKEERKNASNYYQRHICMNSMLADCKMD